MSQTINIAGTVQQGAEWICVPQQATENNTPVLYFSIVVPENKCVRIEVVYQVYKADFSTCDSGRIEAQFIRGSGNITKKGGDIPSIIPGFTGAKPSLVLTANTSTQSIDATITGISGSLVHIAKFNLQYNT